MWTKICANTNLADAQLAAEMGADGVGFVFAPSTRQVTAEQVAAITEHLPGHVDTIGVFATQDAATILDTAETAGLSGVQLHSSLNIGFVQTLDQTSEGTLKIIQTVAYEVNPEDPQAADATFVETLVAALGEPTIWAVLVDAAKSGVSGGLGVTFDWGHVVPLLQTARERSVKFARTPQRMIVAGGLRAENVAEAIRVIAPWGVDVASGVEASVGKKDPQRLREFLAAARSVSGEGGPGAAG